MGEFQLPGIVAGDLIREEATLFTKAYRRLKQSSGTSGNQLYLKASLLVVMAKILELHGQGAYAGKFLNGRKPRRTEGSLDVLQDVFQYVDANLQRSIRMNELAAIAGVSEKYFISYFKNRGHHAGSIHFPNQNESSKRLSLRKNIRSNRSPASSGIPIRSRFRKPSRNITTCLLRNSSSL